jgi:hypothetical protein
LKPVEVTSRRRGGKRVNSGGDETNQSNLSVYMQMSQQNPLYKYYILIKALKRELLKLNVLQLG